MSVYNEPREILPIFNPYDWEDNSNSTLTQDEADQRYLRLAGGTERGDVLFKQDIDVDGTFTGTQVYGSNIDYTGSLQGPTGIFTSMKSTNADLTNIVCTSLTGSTLYGSGKCHFGGTTRGIELHSITNYSYIDFHSHNTYTDSDSRIIVYGAGITGSITNGDMTINTNKLTIEAPISCAYTMTGTTFYGSNINYTGSLIGPTGSFSTLSSSSGLYSKGTSTFGNFSANDYVEIDSTANTSYIDFHSGFNPDYDTRLISTGGITGTAGSGTLGILAGTTNISGNVAFDTNTLYVDATNNRVGIGTTSPTVTCEVIAGSGDSTVLIGRNSTTQRMSLFQSGSSQYIDITGDYQLNFRNGDTTSKYIIHDLSGPKLIFSNNGAIECAAGTLFSNTTYNSTTTASADLTISGIAGYIQRTTSSIKYKTQVEDLEDKYSEQIYNMRPVWYRSTCEVDRKDWGHYGLIAEELDLIDKRLVTYNTNTGEAENVQYIKIVPLLIKEIQKLKRRIDDLES